jgi:ABC-type glycerol-3-phosphate transport system substrate-binding protein
MRRTILAGTSLLVLAACSGGSDAVGENSAGSIKTTAVGNVVATIPSPTPQVNSNDAPAMNAASAPATNAAEPVDADTMMSNVTVH